MPNRQKEKGNRAENLFVKKLRGLGIKAQRVPLSGAAGDKFAGDIAMTYPGLGDLLGEVKVRAEGTGFKKIEGWMGLNDILFLKKDRGVPLVVLSWETFERFVKRVLFAYDAEQRESRNHHVFEEETSEQWDGDPVPVAVEQEAVEAPLFDTIFDTHGIAGIYNSNSLEDSGD